MLKERGRVSERESPALFMYFECERYLVRSAALNCMGHDASEPIRPEQRWERSPSSILEWNRYERQEAGMVRQTISERVCVMHVEMQRLAQWSNSSDQSQDGRKR